MSCDLLLTKYRYKILYLYNYFLLTLIKRVGFINRKMGSIYTTQIDSSTNTGHTNGAKVLHFKNNHKMR